MSFETDITDLCETVFGSRVWMDTTPDGMPRADMNEPFVIVQQVGGVERIYLDNTLTPFQNARMQFFIWGDLRIAVADAARALRKAIVDANTATFITMPLSAVVSDYNDVLKLRGARQDFGFWYPDPLALQ